MNNDAAMALFIDDTLPFLLGCSHVCKITHFVVHQILDEFFFVLKAGVLGSFTERHVK